MITAAVPQQPASLKSKISSTEMGRRSGLKHVDQYLVVPQGRKLRGALAAGGRVACHRGHGDVAFGAQVQEDYRVRFEVCGLGFMVCS